MLKCWKMLQQSVQRALKYQSPTLKNNTPLFFVQSLPKPANCPNHPFLGSSPLYTVFLYPPLKLDFFSEPP